MMEAARTSETSVDNYFTRQYIPEDKSELQKEKKLFRQMTGLRALIMSSSVVYWLY
jgi:hypothetical protein